MNLEQIEPLENKLAFRYMHAYIESYKTKEYKMKTITVVPAYGRDYTSKAKTLVDWNDNKDFIIANMFHAYNGKPANKSDLSGYTVQIRYNFLQRILVVNNE